MRLSLNWTYLDAIKKSIKLLLGTLHSVLNENWYTQLSVLSTPFVLVLFSIFIFTLLAALVI